MNSPEIQTLVDAEHVRFCINEIKSSPQFRNAAQLCEFLDHLVEHTFSGEKEGLKAAVLAGKLYSKTEDEPKDNAVRNLATQFRKKLTEYYQSGGGQGHKYRISLPDGPYKLKFELLSPPPVPVSEPLPPPPLQVFEPPPIPPSPMSAPPTLPAYPSWVWFWGFLAGLAAGIVVCGLFWMFWYRVISPGTPTGTIGINAAVDGTLGTSATDNSTQTFHTVDFDRSVDGTEIHYGSVVRGRVTKPGQQMYLLVLESSGLNYYVQPNHGGYAPLTFCQDGSFERQVWPGHRDNGDQDTFTLVLAEAEQLPNEFPKEKLPENSVRKALLVKRVPPLTEKPYRSKCDK